MAHENCCRLYVCLRVRAEVSLCDIHDAARDRAAGSVREVSALLELLRELHLVVIRELVVDDDDQRPEA